MAKKKNIAGWPVGGRIAFDLGPDKGYEKSGISFPTSDADLDGEIEHKLKMAPGLKRFAKNLTLQLREKYGSDRITGVILNSIGFQMILQKKKE
ncbi:unnamed protein product [marine sediment metagenome]|uniref:Uncharacterized protein n=1 Tax=marine sediment metagenome TaxID=412755 RepID=X0TNQ7_9ZZZZ